MKYLAAVVALVVVHRLLIGPAKLSRALGAGALSLKKGQSAIGPAFSITR